MKKNLLLMVLLATSVVASAQVFKSSLMVDAKSRNMETIKQHPVQVSAPLTKKTDFKAVNKSMRKNEGLELPLKLIQTEYTNSSDGINRCSVVEFVEANVQDEAGNIYNVGIKNFGGQDGNYYSANGGEEIIYGIYDAEASTITVPAGQFIYLVGGEGYDYTYECYLYGWDKDDQGLDEFVFEIGEDGSMESNVAVYQVLFEDSEDGETYYMFMGSEPRFLAVNAIQTGYTTRSGGWAFDLDDPAAVEDFEYSVNIMNFCGNNLITAEIEDDLTVSLPLNQIVGDYDYTAWGQRNGYPYDFGYFQVLLSEVIDEEGHIAANYEKNVTGHVEGNTMYLDDMVIQTNYIDNVGCLRDAFYSEYTLTLDNGNFSIVGDVVGDVTGIVNANATRESKIKNTKTYNLMGQQVDRKAVKGLMIRDGKKYIAK